MLQFHYFSETRLPEHEHDDAERKEWALAAVHQHTETACTYTRHPHIPLAFRTTERASA